MLTRGLTEFGGMVGRHRLDAIDLLLDRHPLFGQHLPQVLRLSFLIEIAIPLRIVDVPWGTRVGMKPAAKQPELDFITAETSL